MDGWTNGQTTEALLGRLKGPPNNHNIQTFTLIDEVNSGNFLRFGVVDLVNCATHQQRLLSTSLYTAT